MLLSRAVAASLVTVFCAACGASSAAIRRDLGAVPVDAATYAEARRRYLELAPDDPGRLALRARLVSFLAERSDAILHAGDYDAVVAHLGALSGLLAPQDFAEPSRLPVELRPLCEYVARHGARRGDEPRVLAAELLLALLDPSAAEEHRREYERVSSWGREARAPANDDFLALVEGGFGLARVWREHARLTPAPEVLEKLAGIFLALHQAVRVRSSAEVFRPPRSLGDMRRLTMVTGLLHRAHLEAATAFLAHGDLDGALAFLERFEDRSATFRLRRALEEARGADARAAEALDELARSFLDEYRPDVATSLCRVGARRFPSDSRFPLCLARASSALGSVGDTADYYAAALRVADADLALYDEALDTFSTMIQRGALSETTDVGEMRTAGRAAHEIVAERARRFPDAPAGPLDQPTLHLALARAELGAGHAQQGRRELEEAITEARRMTELPPAAIEARELLATLELRAGSAARAQHLLGEALSLLSQSPSADTTRARLLVRSGEAAQRQGDDPTARRSYERARALLEGGSEQAAQEEPDDLAMRAVLLGLVERRLGRAERSRAAFERAIALAPTPEVAAEILTHLVTDGPDVELADLVFRRARVGSSIGHAWKVRLALRVVAVHALAGAPESEDASRVLTAEAVRGGWYARLAGLARGEIDPQALLEAAQGPPERCEAHFHLAIRALRAGDREAARRALEASVETGMVARDEFAMAQEILRSMR